MCKYDAMLSMDSDGIKIREIMTILTDEVKGVYPHYNKHFANKNE